MKIFLITSGEYSDYHVAAAYSTLELAETALRSGAFDEKNSRIEDFDIDPPTTTYDEIERGWRFWGVSMDSDGNVKDIHEESKHAAHVTLEEKRSRWTVVRYDKVPPTCYSAKYDNLKTGDWYVHVFADSKERAIKSAAEKRAFAMANQFLGESMVPGGKYNLPDETKWKETKP